MPTSASGAGLSLYLQLSPHSCAPRRASKSTSFSLASVCPPAAALPRRHSHPKMAATHSTLVEQICNQRTPLQVSLWRAVHTQDGVALSLKTSPSALGVASAFPYTQPTSLPLPAQPLLAGCLQRRWDTAPLNPGTASPGHPRRPPAAVQQLWTPCALHMGNRTE